MSIDPVTKAQIDNGLTVIRNTNGMNMYDLWSIWLSYNLVSQKNKIDELSKKRVSSLSLEDLEYYLECKKQQELSKVFRRVFDGIGSKEDIKRAYDYADNHSLIDLMINKLSKEELEYAKDKLYYLSTLKEDEFEGYKVEHDLDNFKNTSDVIIANRYDEELEDEIDKVYTRDIFRNN